jgi:hypothetical protein
VSLSEHERALVASAGSAPQQLVRGQAVAVVLGKSGVEAEEARLLLAESFVATTQPSFHLIPRGDAMTGESDFDAAYEVLGGATSGFTKVTLQTLKTALLQDGTALAALRMIIGFTHNELAAAMKLISPEAKVSGDALKKVEREEPPTGKAAVARRDQLLTKVVTAVLAVMEGSILTVPEASSAVFHSKLDKRDTREGWTSVARDAGGVPYSALLYQRYVGGVWRQVQDAYSEVKGDALVEAPLTKLLERERISFYHSERGASGAARTAQRYGITPGPDFLLPEEGPAVIIESKIGEDGGTVRDKAARIRTLAAAGAQRGLVVGAVVDGKGWSERPTALAEVVIATGGRTYTLATLEHLLNVPEVAALKGTAEAKHP